MTTINSIAKKYYQPTDTTITLYENGLAIVSFGQATVNLAENTKESRWVKSVFDDFKARRLVDGLRVLLNMSQVDAAEYNSDESNEIYKAMLKDPFTKRVAMVGMNPGWELMLEIFRFFGKDKIRGFISEDQAREWLTKLSRI